MDEFLGRYDFFESIGVDEYLKYLGAGIVFRKVQNAARPSLAFSKDETTKEWILHIASMFYSYELKFKIKETVEDETFDARPCFTTVTFDKKENCIALSQVPEEGCSVKILLQKTDNTIKMTHDTESRSCHLVFKNEKEFNNQD